MPRASPEPDQKDQGTELTQHKKKIRDQKIEIRKLRQSNKLRKLELEAKDVTIARLLTANEYLTRTAKPEAEEE